MRSTEPWKAKSERTRTVSTTTAIAILSAIAIFGGLTATAQAARPHEFKGVTIGEPGSGPGQLSEPSGVAVNEATGDVYVVDRGNQRVQWFAPKAGGGYEFAGEVKGPSGEGSGELTAGSDEVASALASSGAFAVGEEIEGKALSGKGIPAGTKIEKVEGATLTLSQPVEAEGSEMGVALKAHEAFLFPTGPETVEPTGVAVAVDNSCAQHKPAPLPEPECHEQDPSGGDVYVVDRAHSVVDKFTAGGEFVTSLTGLASGTVSVIKGVAVDPAGQVWLYATDFSLPLNNVVVNLSDERVNAILGSRELALESFPAPDIAVDANDDIYALEGYGREVSAGKYSSSSGQPLGGPLDGEDTTGVAVNPASGLVFVDNMSSIAVFSTTNEFVERFAVAGGAGGGRVAVDAGNETVFASTPANVVNLYEPTPVKAPAPTGISTSQVTGDSAVLSGEVKPNGAASTYSFEYGSCPPDTTSCPGTPFTDSLPSPEGSVGAENDFNSYPVSVHVQALKPGTVYHYRLHAHSLLGEGNAEGTFRTQNPPGSFALLDNRAWEMVSPPDKHGAGLKFIGHGQVTQAATAGGAFTYLADAPTEAQPAGYAVLVQVLSKRGPDGWESHDLALPHGGATGSTGSEYVAFDEGLSSAIVQPIGAFEPSLTAEAPQRATEQTPYLADLAASHTLYTPLVTAANDPFHPFGEEGRCPPQSLCGPKFTGATPDLKHVVLQSHVALTETPLVKSNDEIGEYEWSEGKLSLLTALPNGQAAGNIPELGSDEGALARNAISADGSRVVWSEHGGDNHLYLRYNATQQQSPIVNGKCSVPSDACTLQLDAVQEGASGENAAEPEFQVASVDGSRVFFSDTQRLTLGAGGGNTGGEGDLYVCQIVVGAGGEQTCDLTDLTPPHNGESADVKDIMPGISGDGCDVGSSGECDAYFVADGILTEEPNAAGEHAVHGNCDGQGSLPAGALCNLYVAHWDGSAWQTRLVAVLSGEDYPDWNGSQKPDRVSGSHVAGVAERQVPRVPVRPRPDRV